MCPLHPWPGGEAAGRTGARAFLLRPSPPLLPAPRSLRSCVTEVQPRQHPQAPRGRQTPVLGVMVRIAQPGPRCPPSRPMGSGQDSSAEPGAAGQLPSARDPPPLGTPALQPGAALLLPSPWPGHVTQTSHQQEQTLNTRGLGLSTRTPPSHSNGTRKDCSSLQGQHVNRGFRSIASCPWESKSSPTG